MMSEKKQRDGDRKPARKMGGVQGRAIDACVRRRLTRQDQNCYLGGAAQLLIFKVIRGQGW